MAKQKTIAFVLFVSRPLAHPGALPEIAFRARSSS